MSFLDFLARSPVCCRFLRSLVERDFRQTKLRIAKHLARPLRRVVDVGCGTGEFCSLFTPDTYIGIDIFEPYISYAQKRHPSYQFICGDGTALEFEAKSIDFLLVSGLVHHLEDQDAQKLFVSAARVLRDNGELLLIEDVPATRFNFLGACMHAIDRGAFIRTQAEYERLASPNFRVRETETYRAGICDYGLFLMQKSFS